LFSFPCILRFLAPFLITRRLFPAFIGGAGADQVHIGAEVLAARAGAPAGAAVSPTQILRAGLLKLSEGAGPEIAVPIANIASYRGRITKAPETIPVLQILARQQWLGRLNVERQQICRLGVNVFVLTPGDEALEKGLGFVDLQRVCWRKVCW